MKDLKDMTIEELWQLFPIELSPHCDQWKDWAMEEMECLSALLAEYSPVINHIGSTAIPDIMAKPIIDILVEISPEFSRGSIRAVLVQAGYICMSSHRARMSFNKGYTPSGYASRVFHIHIHETGDNEEIHFRDCLRNDPDLARQYERLKLSLLPEYKYDRDGYTEAKTDFVKSISPYIRSHVSMR